MCNFVAVKTTAKMLLTAGVCAAMWACSSVKHVPDGQYLLNDVNIHVTDSAGEIKTTELFNFLRQQPNHKVLGFAKLQLATYSLSGRDSSKWYNRWLRRIGQPPVIYDSTLTEMSRRQLRQALVNKGYTDARVTVDTASRKAKRMSVNYNIAAGRPHVIGTLSYEIDDPQIGSIVIDDTITRSIGPGDMLDRNRLDAERARITEVLRNKGYYAFNREYITFTADTVRGSKEVALTMHVRAPQSAMVVAPTDTAEMHNRFIINKIYFVTDFQASDADESGFSFGSCDTVRYRDIEVLYGPDHYIKPDILYDKCYLRTGKPYSAQAVQRTYESLSQLGILKFINIEMRPVADGRVVDGIEWLDAYVLLSRNKKQSIAIELMGTNSEGDFGVGVGVTYQHRNLAKRSNLFTAKLRASYESLKGNFEGIINHRYTEYAGEVGITFPKFEAPFLSRSFKQRMRASTEFALSANYQERPEYTRLIFGGAWRYKWMTQWHRDYSVRQTYDFVDINYVRLPRSTLNFIDSIAPTNPLLRYSYEDHFIMQMGYTYYRTNRRIPTTRGQNSFELQPTITTLRASVQTAGNLLYGLSAALGVHKGAGGAYKLLGVQFAQYVKAEFDWTHVHFFNSRNALAWRTGFGIGYPYGNSSMIPFEKRFYGGGANGVRGWSVRTLGPGCYDARNNVTDFINQCGDINLILSMEYRLKLFWVFEAALFIDAGNIWTIKDYETQPGGLFKFNTFYKQIAGSYGAGLRMDFTYFMLRFDLGMKAHNPAKSEEPWPLVHPRWSRDATFHFAVGYPF